VRILFLTTRPPWPSRRGDQFRTAQLVTYLEKRHEVRVMAQHWPSFAAKARPGLELVPIDRSAIGRALGRILIAGFDRQAMPIQARLFEHRAFEQAVDRALHDFRPDVVVVMLSRLGHLLDRLQGVPVVLDMVDALHLNMAERGRRERLLAPIWRLESARQEAWDRRILARGGIATATVVAERDRRALVALFPDRIDQVEVLPLGVEVGTPFAWRSRRFDVAITGNLGYFPTLDGLRFFLRAVWPRLCSSRPGTTLLLAGARPPSALVRAAQQQGITLVADPEDLRAWSRQARVAVAPLFSGSGTPIKILEALADGLPVITTAMGAAGLDPAAADLVTIATEAPALVTALLEALDDEEAAELRIRRGQDFIRSHHDIDQIGVRFESILANAAGARISCP
jgi:polysaccharide biosynthesis protein PslH